MSAEPVVLLHGLWMPAGEMWLVRRRLEADGRFEGLLFGYPSLSAPLDENADALFEFIIARNLSRAHLVGHSLGGIVALRMLARHADAPPGRVVCLGSPLAGSRPAQILERSAWGRKAVGNSLCQVLGDNPASDWAQQVTATREVGIIAGTRSVGLGRLVTRFAGDNDGTVAVAETRLPGAKDHLCLPVTHTTLATSRDVAEQTAAFLAHGEFLREP